MAEQPLYAATSHSSTQAVRIFILARSSIYVEGLGAILGGHAGFELVACAEPGKGCFEKFLQTRPDVLLVHRDAVRQPMREFFRNFRDVVPHLGTLAFGASMDQELLFNVLRAGANGYISEDMNSDDLCDAVHTASTGRLWMRRELFEQMVGGALELEETVENAIRERLEEFKSGLADREIKIFQCVMQGMTTREIAETVHLSEQGVKLYLGRLFKRFDVTNRSQLILLTFQKICPASNLIRLFRMAIDKRRIDTGRPPLIPDPLALPNAKRSDCEAHETALLPMQLPQR